MKIKIVVAALVILIVVVVGILAVKFVPGADVPNPTNETKQTNQPHVLSIENLQKGNYPGSEIAIEQELGMGSSYNQYIVSYKSEGLKIYGLLTVPSGQKPEGGYPVIVFNHGYIPPAQYRTTERYIAYVDAFASNGYVVFKPDYRGHGQSEGQATGAYGSTAYTIDVLNALSSVKKLKEVNPDKIGMWGHSLGGYITLRVMVVDSSVKAGVIWAGVVGSYEDLLYNWRRTPPPGIPSSATSWRSRLIGEYGDPAGNPDFWNSISATSFLSNISGPLQLHHGTADESVPHEFSENLKKRMDEAGKTVEYWQYEGDDHNLTAGFQTAADRSVKFFDQYLKN